MRRILVPLDLGETTGAVLAQARALAVAFSAELTLVHVAAPEPDFVSYEAGPPSVRAHRARELRTEHRRVQELAEELRAAGLAAKGLLVQGPTVATILDVARNDGADAVVMGSRGRGALARALLGSVAEGVLRAAPCPVLVVPARSEPKASGA